MTGPDAGCFAGCGGAGDVETAGFAGAGGTAGVAGAAQANSASDNAMMQADIIFTDHLPTHVPIPGSDGLIKLIYCLCVAEAKR